MLWADIAVIVGLVAFVAAALAIYSRSVLAVARRTFPPIGRIVAVDGVALHYVRRGPAGSRPVVLLHGSDRVLQDFTMSVLDHLALQYDTVAFDRPGHGYSTRPPTDALTLGLNARVLRDALRTIPVPRPVMVGHGAGAAVALQYAVSYPAEVAGLVLLSPVAFANGSGAPPLAYLSAVPLVGAVLDRTLLVPVAQALAGAFSARTFAPAAVPPDYTETIAAFAVRPDQFAAVSEERRRLPSGLAEIAARLSDMRVPAVIVAGERDQVVRPERQAVRLHAALPDSKLVMLAGVGHQLHYERPEAVVEAVGDAWDLSG